MTIPYFTTAPTYDKVVKNIESYVAAWEHGDYSHAIETIIEVARDKPARLVYLTALFMRKLKPYDQSKFINFMSYAARK